MKQHFVELQARLLRSFFVLMGVFIACYYYSNFLYNFITNPILKYLDPSIQVITSKVTAPFMVPMQLSFLSAILICAPYLLYQLWQFISPGLYKNERRNILPFIVLSAMLFYIGFAFAILVICPVALKFFTSCAPNGVTVMLDIGDYLDFIVTVAIATGIAFQIPVVTNLLIRIGIISKIQLASKRKHVIVLTLIVGMLLAPPDVFSQLLIALPMWGLFETGLLLSRSQ